MRDATTNNNSYLPNRLTILILLLILSPLLFVEQQKALEHWDFFLDWKASVRKSSSVSTRATTTIQTSAAADAAAAAAASSLRQNTTIHRPNNRTVTTTTVKKYGSIPAGLHYGLRPNSPTSMPTPPPIFQLELPPPESQTQFEINLDPALIMQREFYQNHYRWMKELFYPKLSNFMIWGTRSEGDGKEFYPFYREFGDDFYDARDQENVTLNGRHYLLFSDVCDAARFFEENNPTPHVLFAVLNENWGAFSELVPNKTVDWIVNLTDHWQIWGCSLQMIQDYIDHTDTKLVVTTQFQTWDHPKIISLPLGIKNGLEAEDLLKYTLAYNKVRNSRTQLLMINCNVGPNRGAAITAVERNFNGTRHEVHNSFVWDWPDKSFYYQEMQRSKFILTPGGMGFDCYRIWEAIIMGTIPIVETLNRTDGWFRTFELLPVALIDSYENLTVEWLEAKYQDIVAGKYDYHRLTKPYWVQLIKSHIDDVTTTETSS